MLLYWIVKYCDLAEEFASEMVLGFFRSAEEAEKYLEKRKAENKIAERPMYWITREYR